MCVICVSGKGHRQPSDEELKAMWNHNSDGAGYMVARNGKVILHKGFMEWEDFIGQIHYEHFTSEDVVCYHFRISTQAGVNPYMCHPFGITRNIVKTKVLDGYAPMGIMHNGIIQLTSDKTQKEYSDTALFITKYLTKLVRNPKDIHNKEILTMISELTNSKWAFLLPNGDIETVGKFTDEDGILVSNLYWKYVPKKVEPKAKAYCSGCGYNWDDETSDDWWAKNLK